jgi:hypothetical protein
MESDIVKVYNAYRVVHKKVQKCQMDLHYIDTKCSEIQKLPSSYPSTEIVKFQSFHEDLVPSQQLPSFENVKGKTTKDPLSPFETELINPVSDEHSE